MSTTTVYLPCEIGQVQVKLGFGDTLSPLEETALRVVGAAGHSDGDAPRRPVGVEDLATLMGLGRRVVLDLVHDLWRAGHLVLDLTTGVIDLSADVAALWRTGRLHELSGVETEDRTVELMIEPLTNHVLPSRGPRGPGDQQTAVRVLGGAVPSVVDAAHADLHGAVRAWLRRQGRPERPEADDAPVEAGGADTWARPRRILSIRTPTAEQRVGGQRWLPLDVRSELSEATGRLVVTVVDNRFPADRRDRASELLTRLVEENPRSQFAIRLREAAEQRLPEPPSVAELVERLARAAATCAETVAGQRRNEHANLAEEARRIEAMLAAQVVREVDIEVVGGAAEHDAVVHRMIDDARRQLVIVCPFVAYAALTPLVPDLRRAIERGVQVVLVWGIGHRYTLPENVTNALNSLTRLSRATPLLRPQVPARTHAKVIVRDDREALVTSRNVLSASHARNEIGVLLRVPRDGGDEAVRDLLGWVRTNVPGAISRSVLRHARDFGRDAPPATAVDVALPEPPPDDDAHPESVRAWSRDWQAHAGSLRERLAGRRRPSVRLVEDGSHRELLWHALRHARARLVVTSGGLSDEIVDSRMIEALRALLDAGVAVTVGYDQRGGTDRGTGAREALSALAAAHPGRCHVHVGTGHAKVLVWDDEAVVGSFNYLSQGGYGAHGGRHTASTELSVRFGDAALADRLAAVCGEPEAVTRELAAARAAAVPVGAARFDRAVLAAARALLDAPPEATAVAGLVRRVLGGGDAPDPVGGSNRDAPDPADGSGGAGGVDPWRVLDELTEVRADRLAGVVAAYCLTERAADAAPETLRRCRRQLAADLWRDARFVEAALVAGAAPDGEAALRAPLALAAAARGLPGAGGALFAAATAAEVTDDEALALLTIAVGELLTTPDETTVLAAEDLAERVGGPWAELARLAADLAASTVGASVTDLTASVSWGRQREARLAAAWELLERRLAEAQPEPSRVEGALKTHAAMFKAGGPFGRVGDMVARRDTVALSRFLDAEFPARVALEETVGRLLDKVWQQAAPRSKLFFGRPRAMYVRRLAEVVAAARHLLELVAAGDEPPYRHHPELLGAAERFVDGYGRLREELPAAGPLAAPLAGTVRADLDRLVAGEEPPPRPEPPDDPPDDLPALLPLWPGRWRYPRLAARLHRAPGTLTVAEAERLLLADLDLEQPSPAEAAGRLLDAGEFDVADALRRDHVLPAAVAERMLADLDRARTAAVSRVAYDLNALRRRARRAGLTLETAESPQEHAAARLADADELLALLRDEVERAERERAAALRAELPAWLSAHRGDPDEAAVAQARAATIEKCVEAREFDVARRLLDDPDPMPVTLTGPRAVPPLARVWPFAQQDRETVLSWYTADDDAPLNFSAWRPPPTDTAAWELIGALRNLAEVPTTRQAVALCVALQRLVGGEHPAYPVRQVGRGHLTRVWLPDYGMLPELPILGRLGMATWVAGPDDPPPVDGPVLWLVPDFEAPRRPAPGVVVVDLAFLLRLAAPVPTPATVTRLVGLLRRVGSQLGPAPLLAEARGPVSEAQVLWLLHLLGRGVDGVVVEAVHHDCGGRLEVLGPLLDALLAGPAPAGSVDVAALERVRDDDAWRDAATERLLHPLAGDLPALLALRVAAAFCGPEFGEEDLREGIAAVGADAHARLVVAHTDLPQALARLVRLGLLESPTPDAYRLPPTGVRDLLTTRRPGQNPDELARRAVEVAYQALMDAVAVRRAAISERVVQLIGHHVAGRLAVARGALADGNLERAAAVLDAASPVLEMYREATGPDETFELVELLQELRRDVRDTNPDVKCEVTGEVGLPVTANRWLVGQALHNLLDNGRRACEASGRGFGLLRVTVSTYGTGTARWCRIDIEDDGIGVSAAVRERLRAGVRSSQWGGRGIGMRNAEEWIADFGGTLRLMDGPGALGGAHVRVTLPLVGEADDA